MEQVSIDTNRRVVLLDCTVLEHISGGHHLNLQLGTAVYLFFYEKFI